MPKLIYKRLQVGFLTQRSMTRSSHRSSDFRPPTMYYTTIPQVSEKPHNRRWDAAKLRELRKRLDSGGLSVEEIDQVASDFLDGEIVDLASDWLGNTVREMRRRILLSLLTFVIQVVQKLFEHCSSVPRLTMLDRIAPHLAMIGIHKNGTWAAQKIIECVREPEEIATVAQHLRAYTPPLFLDQYGNYVVQYVLPLSTRGRGSDLIFLGAAFALALLQTISFLMPSLIECGRLPRDDLVPGACGPVLRASTSP